MKNQKAFQRDQLVLQFGILISPLSDLAQADPSPSIPEYRIAVAKVQAGDAEWRRTARELTTFADDIIFNEEYQDIAHVPERLRRRLRGLVDDPKSSADLQQTQFSLRRELEQAQADFLEYLDRVPVVWEPVVFDANTPFTSYLRIRESIAVVRHRLHYFDRYLKPGFYSLFLSSVARSVSVRLVTTAGTKDYGVAAVAPISDLCRHEFDDYQLMEIDPKDLHDRNLRVDDQMFTLGPGVDRAGMSLTNFGPSDPSPEAHAAFDRLLAKGRVIHTT